MYLVRNPAAERKALSIDMSNSNIDTLSLIEKLESVLSLLDKNGHPLAAIKVEEAINTLQHSKDPESDTGD